MLLQYYTFGEYEKFYEQNFMGIPELEIDGYTIDEPDYREKKVKTAENNNKEVE